MGMTQEEKASIVSAFLVTTTSSYSPGPDSPVTGSSSTVAAALHTNKRWATWAFAHSVAKTSISLSFMTFMMMLIVGVPRMTETCTMKFDKSGTTRDIWSLF